MGWILLFIGIVFLGLWGGQKDKGARRIGLPILSFLASLKNFRWRNLGLLTLIPALYVGYGENSVFMDFFGVDWLVRLAYGGMLAIPFLFFGWRRFLVAVPLLMGAFSVRAGLLFSIGTFDVLIEDIVRYSALGGLIVFNLRRR